MTTAKPIITQLSQPGEFFVFPDPVKHPEDKMTSFDHLTITGNAHYLAIHLGNRETTLVAGDRYLALAPTRNLAGVRYPDMLVAFDVNPKLYKARNAYVIEDQGKPPDLVMEIASRRTGRVDVTAKRDDYAALGIPEYWRFDETGEYHGTRLAGDRLEGGVYAPVTIEELGDGMLQGYSAVLGLNLRWEDGQLRWHDPATGRYVPTFESERARAEVERARANMERGRADAERTRADAEAAARMRAEERVRRLEAELRGDG